MAEVQTGMDKSVMKQMLAKSKKEPVSCAMAQGKDAAFALLMLDKVKSPKALLKDLEKQFPDAKHGLFGTAVVDPDTDATLVKFQVNKAASGMAKRLTKTLKGTGYNKVQLVLEDGSTVESGSDEDAQPGAPQAAGASPAPPPSQAANVAPPPSPQDANVPPAPPPPQAANVSPPPPPQAANVPPAPPSPATDPNAADLTQRLTGLVKRMVQVAASDPSRLGQLKGLAAQAQASLKTGDLLSASDAADSLEQALQGGAAPAAPAPSAAPPAPPAASAPAAPNGPAAPQAPASTMAKSRLAWVATRKKIETDIGKLKGEIMAACKGQDIEAALEAGFRSKVEPVLAKLDESLSDKLDEVNNAADANQRTKLIAEAKQIMQRYQSFVASEPIIKHLDENPFVPLAIGKTLTATLTTLASAVR